MSSCREELCVVCLREEGQLSSYSGFFRGKNRGKEERLEKVLLSEYLLSFSFVIVSLFCRKRRRVEWDEVLSSTRRGFLISLLKNRRTVLRLLRSLVRQHRFLVYSREDRRRWWWGKEALFLYKKKKSRNAGQKGNQANKRRVTVGEKKRDIQWNSRDETEKRRDSWLCLWRRRWRSWDRDRIVVEEVM